MWGSPGFHGMPCLFRDMQTKSRKGIALVLLLQVVLLQPLGSGASGEETVQSSNLLPSAAPDFLGRKTSTVSRSAQLLHSDLLAFAIHWIFMFLTWNSRRPLIVFSTIDGGIHGLEARTGTLRWTVPSGDPVVNFAKPEEEKRERRKKNPTKAPHQDTPPIKPTRREIPTEKRRQIGK